MSNSISDWNIIDSKQIILEQILENGKNINILINSVVDINTKIKLVSDKLDKLTEKIDDLNNDKLSIKTTDINLDLNNFKKLSNTGLKSIVNEDLYRIKNNMWRQSKTNTFKHNTFKHNSYITTPNIPLDYNL
jgi:2C-methyl-D-erythritol 2,4-cyclodiphosphate synthase